MIHTTQAPREYVRGTVREAKSRRRALAEGDAQMLAQIERRRKEDERKKARFAAGLRRQAMGR